MSKSHIPLLPQNNLYLRPIKYVSQRNMGTKIYKRRYYSYSLRVHSFEAINTETVSFHKHFKYCHIIRD